MITLHTQTPALGAPTHAPLAPAFPLARALSGRGGRLRSVSPSPSVPSSYGYRGRSGAPSGRGRAVSPGAMAQPNGPLHFVEPRWVNSPASLPLPQHHHHRHHHSGIRSFWLPPPPPPSPCPFTLVYVHAPRKSALCGWCTGPGQCSATVVPTRALSCSRHEAECTLSQHTGSPAP
jgi:hypothetical protein